MDLEEYKKLIKMAVSAKESKEKKEEKEGLEILEINLRQGLREQELLRILHDLYGNKQFIGYICVTSQYVEFSVKRIIVQLQKIAALLNKKFPNKNWEKETLGSLIDVLENYCINDLTLIEHLKDFNNLRIKAIHKLFDIVSEIKDVEEEIKLKLSPSSYHKKIIIPLGMYFYAIINKNIEIKGTMDQVPQKTKMSIGKLNEELEKEYSNFSNFNKENILKNIKI